MTLLRVGLLALAIAVIGCGGHVTDDDAADADSALDSSPDRDAVGVSDGVLPRDGDASAIDVGSDARDMSSVDGGGDRRPEAPIDTRDANATSDTRDADISGDIADASDEDTTVDIHADVHDVSVDTDGPRDRDAADAAPPDEGGGDVAPPPFDADAGGDGCSAVTCDLVALSVFPPSPTIIARTTRWMQATGTYFDGSTRDLTNDVVWSTSQPQIALMSTVAGRGGLLTAMNAGTVTVTAEIATLSASTVVEVSVNEPRIIQIRPSVPSLAQGTQRQLTAMVTFSDGSQADWSSVLTWSSSAPAVATVSAEGIAAGLSPGTTTITAALVWLTGSTTLTVTPATLSSISITPATLSLPLGLVQPLRAVGLFSDGTMQDLTAQATWSSSDLARVTVGDGLGTKGKITGAALGSATVTAAFGGMSATAAIDVSAAVLQSFAILYPPGGRLMLSMEMLLASHGSYSDGSMPEITDFITWISSDPSVLEVSGQRIFARREGQAHVTGTYAGVQGILFVGVFAGALESIEIRPSPAVVARGASASFYATGNYTGGTTYDLTWFGGWNTVDDNVAWVQSVPASPARLWGVNVGTTNVSVAWAGIAASSVVNVTTTADAGPGP